MAGDHEGAAPAGGMTIGEAIDDLELARLPMTDLGNRDRLLRRRGRDLADDDANHLAWDGRRWAVEPKSLPNWTMAAQEAVEAIHARELPALTASFLPDDPVAKTFIPSFRKFAKESASVGAVTAMLKAVRPHVRVPAEQWNSHDNLLNVANGTLRIASDGVTLQPHRREDRLTHIAPTIYDERAQCPLFERTLETWFPEADDRRFLQRLCGAMLVNSSADQVFVVWQGAGGDGKGVMLNTLRAVLGDYVMTMDPNSLLSSQRDGAGPAPDIARLMSEPRLVVAEEPERGRTLAEGMIKGMTGGGKVPARALYSEVREFTPRFKLVLVCNELPIVKGGDEGVWRRLVRLKWRVSFKREEYDTSLERRLALEAPGILNWLIEGCLNWMEMGLAVPERVIADTLEWRDVSDNLGRFLAECCERDEGARVEVGVLYDCYAAWAKAEGGAVMSKTALGKALTTAKQIQTLKSNGMKFRIGIKLSPSAPRGGAPFDDSGTDPRDREGYGDD